MEMSAVGRRELCSNKILTALSEILQAFLFFFAVLNYFSYTILFKMCIKSLPFSFSSFVIL